MFQKPIFIFLHPVTFFPLGWHTQCQEVEWHFAVMFIPKTYNPLEPHIIDL